MCWLTCMQPSPRPLALGHPAAPRQGCCPVPPTAGPLQVPQMGVRARRHLPRPKGMARKQAYPAAVLPLSPSPVPPSPPKPLPCPPPATARPPPHPAHGCRAASCTPGTHRAQLSARRRKVYSAPCVGAASLGRGEPTSRLLGGTGRKQGRGKGVFPSQDAGSRRDPSPGAGQQRPSGMQVGQQGAGSSGPRPHHLTRVKTEVPTLRGSRVSRRGGRAAGREGRVRAHLVAFQASLRDGTSSHNSHMVSSVSFPWRSTKHWPTKAVLESGGVQGAQSLRLQAREPQPLDPGRQTDRHPPPHAEGCTSLPHCPDGWLPHRLDR